MIDKTMTLDKVVMTRAARRELLRSAKVEEDISRRTEAIRQSAGGRGSDVISEVSTGRARVRGSVVTNDAAKIRDNALLRALDAGRQ